MYRHMYTYARMCVQIYVYPYLYSSARKRHECSSSRLGLMLDIACARVAMLVALLLAVAGAMEQDELLQSIAALEREHDIHIASFPAAMFTLPPATSEVTGPSQASTATHQNNVGTGEALETTELQADTGFATPGASSHMASAGVPPNESEDTETVEVAISTAIGRWLSQGLDRAMVTSRLRAMRSFLERIECQMEEGGSHRVWTLPPSASTTHLVVPQTPPTRGTLRSRSPPPPSKRSRRAEAGRHTNHVWFPYADQRCAQETNEALEVSACKFSCRPELTHNMPCYIDYGYHSWTKPPVATPMSMGGRQQDDQPLLQQLRRQERASLTIFSLAFIGCEVTELSGKSFSVHPFHSLGRA